MQHVNVSYVTSDINSATETYNYDTEIAIQLYNCSLQWNSIRQEQHLSAE